jgi:hypothetical protein
MRVDGTLVGEEFAVAMPQALLIIVVELFL